MAALTRTTEHGTIISLEEAEGRTVVILEHPSAPEDMRYVEAGRVERGGFQPAVFAAFALRPSALRALADLIDQQDS